jgi:molybdopterin molybdotransferase
LVLQTRRNIAGRMSSGTMLEFDEAVARVLAKSRPLATERVPLSDGFGRVLAEELRAEAPFPPFAQSAMDGYALSLGDLSGDGPWTLPVCGESRAGAPALALQPGAVCRIFTGAMLPQGADAVVIQENTERSADSLLIRSKPRPLENVRRQGEDLECGALALATGTRLGPAQLALIAALDRASCLVSSRPRVAILSTGDELRPPGSVAQPATIPESNSIAIAAYVRAVGGLVTVLPRAPDELDAIASVLENAARGHDLLVTIGGVSVGDRDLVRAALERIGAREDFWKVRMKPGKPLVLSQTEHALVLGLPGNPVSAQITFCLFGVPLLRALQGDGCPLPQRRTARLTSVIRQKPGRQSFVRAHYSGSDVTPLENQASGAVTSLAWANCLVIVPAECSQLEAQSSVEVIALSDL